MHIYQDSWNQKYFSNLKIYPSINSIFNYKNVKQVLLHLFCCLEISPGSHWLNFKLKGQNHNLITNAIFLIHTECASLYTPKRGQSAEWRQLLHNSKIVDIYSLNEVLLVQFFITVVWHSIINNFLTFVLIIVLLYINKN